MRFHPIGRAERLALNPLHVLPQDAFGCGSLLAAAVTLSANTGQGHVESLSLNVSGRTHHADETPADHPGDRGELETRNTVPPVAQRCSNGPDHQADTDQRKK